MVRKKRERRGGETPAQRERRQACEDLYVRLMAGEDGAAEKLILANQARVKEIAAAVVLEQPKARYLNPEENSDLESAGLESLVATVEAMPRRKPLTGVDGYLHNAIENGMRKAIMADHSVAPSADWMMARRRAGKQTGELRGISHTAQSLAADFCPMRRNGQPMGDPRERVNEAVAEIESRDSIEALCETKLDRDILRLRGEGFTDREIEKRLGVDHVVVYRARKAMRERFYCEATELLHDLTLQEKAERCCMTLEDAARMPHCIDLEAYAKA